MKIYTNKKICIKHTRMIPNGKGNGHGDRGKQMATEMKNLVENLDDKVGQTSYRMEQKDEKQKKKRVINKRTSLGDPISALKAVQNKRTKKGNVNIKEIIQ